MQLNEKQIEEYLHRSYTAVDGLWFMKLEEKYGFGEALTIDREVWKVMPKIQARLLKSMYNLDNGMEALFICFTTKLTLDGFSFETQKIKEKDGFQIVIRRCPWHEVMIKSGRDSLSGRVGDVICSTEYSVWAAEFGGNIHCKLEEQICTGAKDCIVQFSI